jgi:AbiV family abortive infection protein
MKMPLTERYLLEGAAFSLQQCGLLLRDAATLYHAKSYASAVVLASLATEESGKWKMLIDLRKEMLRGKQVTVDDLQRMFRKHEAKQAAGLASTTMRGKDEEEKQLLKALFAAKPGSEEWRRLHERIDKKMEELRNRLPAERFSDRMAALYVDPVSETEWSKPIEKVTAEFAYYTLTEAMNDYSGRMEKYSNLGIMAVVDAELAEALDKWTDRPELLGPEHPAFPEPA